MTDLSYQLYSSREFPPLSSTLHMLGKLGISQVEGYGALYADLTALLAALDSSGLTMSSGHFGLDMIEADPDKVVAIARATGMRDVYCPFLPRDQRPSDKSGWRSFGERLDRAGEPIRDAGLAFGWHNHDFEFRKQGDGTVPMEEILAGGPKLTWEVDVAWIIRGGSDPFDWINRHGNRISAVHVKDIAPAGHNSDEDGWADLGHGTVDWNRLLKAFGNTPAELYVLEHDKPSDDERFARRSITAFKAFQE